MLSYTGRELKAPVAKIKRQLYSIRAVRSVRITTVSPKRPVGLLVFPDCTPDTTLVTDDFISRFDILRKPTKVMIGKGGSARQTV